MPERRLKPFLRLQSLVFAPALVLGLVACEGGRSEYGDVELPRGDPARGAQLITEVGCGSCHAIPGIDGAEGVVGPPLTRWSERSMIAGKLPNKPANLVRWLKDAPSVEAHTAMPDLDITNEQARDIAAYLYTLE